MENLDPTFVWMLAGFVGTGVLALLRKFFPSFDNSAKMTKQVVCLVYSAIVVIGWPLLNGQALPSGNVLIANLVTTFTASLSAYAIVRAAKKVAK